MFQKAKLAALGLFLAGATSSCVSEPRPFLSPKQRLEEKSRLEKEINDQKKRLDRRKEEAEKELKDYDVLQNLALYDPDHMTVLHEKYCEGVKPEREIEVYEDYKVQGKKIKMQYASPEKMKFQIRNLDGDESNDSNDFIAVYKDRFYRVLELNEGLVLCPVEISGRRESDGSYNLRTRDAPEVRTYAELVSGFYKKVLEPAPVVPDVIKPNNVSQPTPTAQSPAQKPPVQPTPDTRKAQDTNKKPDYNQLRDNAKRSHEELEEILEKN